MIRRTPLSPPRMAMRDALADVAAAASLIALTVFAFGVAGLV